MWISKKTWREEREKDRQLLLEALREVTSSVKAQAAAMQSYLAFFEPEGEPESRVIRDEDEFHMEMERIKAAQRWDGDES